MAYSSEVVARARARLAQARQEREQEYAEHLRVAYARVPRLRQIDRELKLTMSRAALAVLDREQEPQTVMAQARERCEALQQERQWLLDDHFEDGFLDESPVCPKCGGQGYIGAQMCECLRELCRQEQRKDLTVLSTGGRDSFESFSLKYYSDQTDLSLGASPRQVMAATLNICQRYARSFSTRSGNLLLSGNTGLGKTFLSACVARAVSEQGRSVVYDTAGSVFAQFEERKFQRDQDDLRQARDETRRYLHCDLLILDDLGSELTTQFTQTALYELVNTRLVAGRNTVISSNLTMEEVARRYSPQIASRLEGEYHVLHFFGDDIRLLKKEQM